MARVVVGDGGVQLGPGRDLRERSELQRHGGDHALAEIADRRREERRARQFGIGLQFGQVLVLEGEGVELELVGLVALGLVILDHGAAAARIAGDAVDGDREVGRQQARLDQRAKGCDGTLRPAAGIAHPSGIGDGLGLAPVHLGEAIGPAVGHAMRGRGVDHAGGVVLDQRHAFLRRIVGQAEDGDIGGVEEALALLLVLALLGRDRDELEVATGGEALADLQTRGTGFAVDEDLRDHPQLQSRGKCRVRYRGCVAVCKHYPAPRVAGPPPCRK